MAIELIKKVFELPPQQGFTNATKLVFLKLADNASEKGVCWPSHGLIEEQCWLSKSAVKAHLKKLQKAGLLTIQHRKNGATNQSNYYQINISLLNHLASSETPQGNDVTEGGSSDTLPLGHDMTDGRASDDPRTVIEPSVKPSNEPSFFKRDKKEATTTKKTTVFIDEWQVSDDLIMSCLAMPNCTNIDIQHELEKFKDYYLSKGEQRADWNASFRNWWRNAIARQLTKPAINGRYVNQPLSISDKASQANEAFLNSSPEKPQPDSFIITTYEVA